jgi:hypothetical protein
LAYFSSDLPQHPTNGLVEGHYFLRIADILGDGSVSVLPDPLLEVAVDENTRAWFGDLAWSPDGSRLVFISNYEDFNCLYVMDSDGSNLTGLLGLPYIPVEIGSGTPPGFGSLWSNEWHPTWSPDGKWIAYSNSTWLYEKNFLEPELLVINVEESLADPENIEPVPLLRGGWISNPYWIGSQP